MKSAFIEENSFFCVCSPIQRPECWMHKIYIVSRFTKNLAHYCAIGNIWLIHHKHSTKMIQFIGIYCSLHITQYNTYFMIAQHGVKCTRCTVLEKMKENNFFSFVSFFNTNVEKKAYFDATITYWKKQQPINANRHTIPKLCFL